MFIFGTLLCIFFLYIIFGFNLDCRGADILSVGVRVGNRGLIICRFSYVSYAASVIQVRLQVFFKLRNRDSVLLVRPPVLRTMLKHCCHLLL